LLLEYVRDAVLFVRRADGRIVAANRAAEETYGRSVDELLGLSIQDLLDPNDIDTTTPFDPTRGGEIDEDGVLFRATHRRADGSTIPVETNARTATIDGEELIVAVVRDISDRVAMEHDLAAAYAEIEQVFETAADGMRIVDLDYNVVRVNETLARMAGVSPDDVLSAKCYETFAGDLCHTEHCPLKRILAGDERFSAETEKTSLEGATLSCLVVARPFVVEGEIVGIIEDFRDITERKHAEELAQHLATHDILTGLPNRMLFNDRLEVVLALAARGDAKPAVLFCDIDHFKTTNDTLGHHVGDEVLRSVAAALTGAVRKADTVARYGGAEFVVLLPNARNIDDALAVARKVLEATGKLAATRGAVELGTTLSIGVATYREDDDLDSLLRRADQAMYLVKQHGGNGLRALDT
jgi:diguanylate cyclase (GGDEF)-like protein/PAS domain S-box-containing protein